MVVSSARQPSEWPFADPWWQLPAEEMACGRSDSTRCTAKTCLPCCPINRSVRSSQRTAPAESEVKEVFQKQKAVLLSGYLYKKSLKQTGVRMGKAWQRRWFVLEVETSEGEEGSIVRTGKLTYYQSNKDTKEGVEIPLHETMSVKGGLGKTKGTEHRITVATPKREFELGSDDKALAERWISHLQEWIGLPKVERPTSHSAAGTTATAVKKQWMEARVV